MTTKNETNNAVAPVAPVANTPNKLEVYNKGKLKVSIKETSKRFFYHAKYDDNRLEEVVTLSNKKREAIRATLLSNETNQSKAITALYGKMDYLYIGLEGGGVLEFVVFCEKQRLFYKKFSSPKNISPVALLDYLSKVFLVDEYTFETFEKKVSTDDTKLTIKKPSLNLSFKLFDIVKSCVACDTTNENFNKFIEFFNDAGEMKEAA